MSNNKTNDAVEYPQMTRYERRKMVVMLKRLRHLIDTDIDKYVEYILSDNVKTINEKPSIEILDNCAYMQDLIRYINQQFDRSSLQNSYTNYSDDIQVTPEQVKKLETLLRNSVDSNR